MCEPFCSSYYDISRYRFTGIVKSLLRESTSSRCAGKERSATPVPNSQWVLMHTIGVVVLVGEDSPPAPRLLFGLLFNGYAVRLELSECCFNIIDLQNHTGRFADASLCLLVRDCNLEKYISKGFPLVTASLLIVQLLEFGRFLLSRLKMHTQEGDTTP